MQISEQKICRIRIFLLTLHPERMISISIVLYHPDWEGEVLPLVTELLATSQLRRLYLVDNSETDARALVPKHSKISYIWNKGANLGYGAAHNIAIRKSVYNGTEVHLVMNSDILLHHEDIEQLYEIMMSDATIGVIAPHVVYPNGETQYLCKLLPTPYDLFARRFLPRWLTRKRDERYTLRRNTRGEKVEDSYARVLSVPYLSGCFLMLRTKAVLQARLFDERYFMYPEDVDLVRTIHRKWKTIYFPDVTITHNHAAASYHSAKMLWVHITNMCRYFNKWGWFFDKERRSFNRLTLQQLD